MGKFIIWKDLGYRLWFPLTAKQRIWIWDTKFAFRGDAFVLSEQENFSDKESVCLTPFIQM